MVEENKNEGFVLEETEGLQDFPEIDPKVADDLRELQTNLLNMNTKLVFEVATCECEKKEDCGVFLVSKEISKILKELQDKAVITVRSRTKKKKR